MQVDANYNPKANLNLRGSYQIAVLDTAANVANANLVTPLANHIYAAVQTIVHAALQTGITGNPAISPGTLRTREIGAGGSTTFVLNNSHIAKAKEFWEVLEKLRKATGAGNKNNVRINPATGALDATAAGVEN